MSPRLPKLARRILLLVGATVAAALIAELLFRRLGPGPVVGRTDEDLWVHGTDQHPNPVGHALLANGIHAYLRDHGLDSARR